MNRNIREKKELPVANIILLVLIALTVIAVMVMGFVVGGKTEHPIEAFMQFIRTGGKAETAETEDPWEEYTDDTEESETESETESQTDITVTETDYEDTETFPPETGNDVSTESVTETTEKVTETSRKPKETTKVTTKDTGRKPDEPRPTVPPITEPSERSKDPNYFSDALFLGDSLTVGLHGFAKIEGATYYGRTSMSITNLWKSTGVAETYENSGNLETFLTKHQFGKIYIMLGINGMGSDLKKSQANYQKMLNKIFSLQPDAIIIIQSCFHVTAKKSASNPAFRNISIENYNDMLKSFVDNQRVFFLDTEGIYDDGNTGAMDEKLSRDGVHIYAKQYVTWKNKILNDGRF